MKGKRFADNRKNRKIDRSKNRNQKENKKTKGRRTKVILLSLLQLIFLALMIFSGIKIYNWYMDNKKSNNQLNEIAKYVTFDKEKDDIDFKSLKEKNANTVGVIKVENTLIEYPVVQGEDNQFYLTHSFDKTYNLAGWVFMDYKNKDILTDKNVVIYGHNRRDNSMFGTLKNILKPEWYTKEENRYVNFVTEIKSYKYEVFSVYQTEKEDYYIKTSFDNNEFENFINTIKSRSIANFKTEVTKDDNILTLSTCANDNRYRVVLHAKRIETTE